MNLEEILIKYNQVAEILFNFLDPKSLVNLGACNRNFREITNSPILWYLKLNYYVSVFFLSDFQNRHKRCKSIGYEKYFYLNNEDSYPLIPCKTTSASPIFSEIGLVYIIIFVYKS